MSVPGLTAAQGLGQFAPLEISLSGIHQPESDLGTISVGLVRAVPVYTLLPQVTPDSYFDALRLEAGAQMVAGETTFRARLTGLDFEIQKSPWAAAFTLLDIDRIGLAENRSDWAGLGFGPGFFAMGQNWTVTFRALGHISATTLSYGDSVFPALKTSDKSSTGAFYGGRATLSSMIGPRLMVEATARMERLSSGAHPVDSQAEVTVQFAISSRVEFWAAGGWNRVEMDRLDTTVNWIGVGIRYRRVTDAY